MRSPPTPGPSPAWRSAATAPSSSPSAPTARCVTGTRADGKPLGVVRRPPRRGHRRRPQPQHAPPSTPAARTAPCASGAARRRSRNLAAALSRTASPGCHCRPTATQIVAAADKVVRLATLRQRRRRPRTSPPPPPITGAAINAGKARSSRPAPPTAALLPLADQGRPAARQRRRARRGGHRRGLQRAAATNWSRRARTAWCGCGPCPGRADADGDARRRRPRRRPVAPTASGSPPAAPTRSSAFTNSTTSRRLSGSLTGHTAAVNAVAFSADGNSARQRRRRRGHPLLERGQGRPDGADRRARRADHQPVVLSGRRRCCRPRPTAR